MRDTLRLKNPTGIIRKRMFYGWPVFAGPRALGRAVRGMKMIAASVVGPTRGVHFCDADTREARAFYANLGLKNDRRYRGSY